MVNLLFILQIFEMVLGLKVNLNKRSLVGINIPHSRLHRVASYLWCPIEPLLIKYLGIC